MAQRPRKPIVRREGNPDDIESGEAQSAPVENEIKVESTPEPIIEHAETPIENVIDDFDGFDDFEVTQPDVEPELEPVLEEEDTSDLFDDFNDGEDTESVDFTEEVVVEEEYYQEEVEESDDTVASLPYDPESSYFFMFGVNGSGKTVILSGLFYNLFAYRMGDNTSNLNDHDIEHEQKGTVLIDELTGKIAQGEWPTSTATLASESSLIPRQMNYEFGPKDHNKPSFKFSMMDMSGEDLMKVRVSSDNGKQRLNPGIEAFLGLPNNNLAFISLFPADSKLSDVELSSYMRNFLDELDRISHKDTPMLFIVSKWDLVADKFDTVEAFLADRAPIIFNKVNESARNVSLMKFSIGNVDSTSDSYVYNQVNSNQMFEWMYHTQMGVRLDEDITASGGFLSKLKGLFGKN